VAKKPSPNVEGDLGRTRTRLMACRAKRAELRSTGGSLPWLGPRTQGRARPPRSVGAGAVHETAVDPVSGALSAALSL
jgi:hypothetical protein